MAIKLRSFSRHPAVKAISFILCVAALTGVLGLLVYTEVRNGSVVSLDETLNDQSFESSHYLSGESERLFDLALNTAGWDAKNQAETDVMYNSTIDMLNRSGGIYYYIQTPYTTLYNTREDASFFKNHKVWYIFWDAESLAVYPDYNSYFDGFSSPTFYNRNTLKQYTAYFCMTDEAVAVLESNYNAAKKVFRPLAAGMLILGVLALICLIHLLLTCGRRAGSGEMHLTWQDRPWLDVSFAAGYIVCVSTFVFLGNLSMPPQGILPSFYLAAIVCLGFALICTAALYWLLALARRIKNRTFLTHTLIGALCTAGLGGLSRTGRVLRNILAHWKVTLQMGIYAGAVSFISMFTCLMFAAIEAYAAAFFMGVLLAGGFAFLAARWSAQLSRLEQGLQKLSEGELSVRVPERGVSFVYRMSRSLNRAGDGMQAAVQSAMKSERFKAELISNVSHDLRTPLTSVITYADLLQSEGLDTPDAPRYVDIIVGKARRLKDLTDDLFEASKAASGEMSAVLVPLDIGQLLSQSLGEMSDRLESAQLDVRLSGAAPLVIADGRMLWRVFENLLGNILKYSLPGSRVYIDVSANPSRASVTLRNISRDPLPADAEFLTERFTRGDEARGGDGSGLGLAIVKSFMELQKGEFSLCTDGDLFKAMLSLPLAPPAEAEQDAEI